MSNQTNAPASLIEQLGTGEDTHGLIGKRVRITNGVEKGNFLALVLGIYGYDGAEATVVHVTEDGSIFADFGDDDGVPQVGPEEARVVAIGHNEQPESEREFEIIE